ncbi:MAG: ABC transporter ATP-binding protein [Candidatus Lokiarchaeota archaeon]
MSKINRNPIIIETHNLSKSYDGINALQDLNLQVRKNSIFGFLGPNGAGKTTTIKLLLGLIFPTSGTGTIFNYDIKRDSMKIRARVGYLPQDPSFYEHMNAREVLEFTIKFYFAGPKAEIEGRANEILHLVDLEDKANRPIKGYSGGERQRLGIAQSMIHYPDLLILDEPTASLDPIGRQAVLELMEKLQEYTTIFYSTHILDDVQKVSDTVGILNHGKLVALGDINELLAGSENPIFMIKLKGPIDNVYKRISEKNWVEKVEIETKGVINNFQVSVKEEETAEKELLRLILQDENINVIDFRKKQYELEEIFLQVIEGDKNV